jgi:ATP-dependent protease Clp ATPase subunit
MNVQGYMEDVMLDLMYEVPAMPHVRSVTITAEVIEGCGAPQIRTA